METTSCEAKVTRVQHIIFVSSTPNVKECHLGVVWVAHEA